MGRIVVTGLGIISAIGDHTAQNRKALINGVSGISTLHFCDSRYSGLRPCGEVKYSTEELKEKLGATAPGTTRTDVFALHAFEEACRDAQLNETDITSADTALIGASTVGGMCLTDELYHDANKKQDGSPYLSSYDCSSATIFLQQRYRIKGIINTINTACSSSANAIIFGAKLLQQGLAKRAIVGGADSIAKFTINGFNALHILSPEACIPFDKNRKGLNLGEGAAFLVLEKEENIKNKKIYAVLSGFGNSNDAFHPTSLSDNGDGPFLSMQLALETAKLSPAQISFINAHGTATENNDLIESKAMIRLFGTPPPFVSSKANTGHTLGAAGAIEAVFSILCLHHQEIYPSLRFQIPIETTQLVPVQKYSQVPLQHIMSNSFGFGGNCSSLIFSWAG